MEEKLALLFDYQRFFKNGRIERMLEELEERYGEELTDEWLSKVSAAGDAWREIGRKCKLMEERHGEK